MPPKKASVKKTSKAKPTKKAGAKSAVRGGSFDKINEKIKKHDGIKTGYKKLDNLIDINDELTKKFNEIKKDIEDFKKTNTQKEFKTEGDFKKASDSLSTSLQSFSDNVDNFISLEPGNDELTKDLEEFEKHYNHNDKFADNVTVGFPGEEKDIPQSYKPLASSYRQWLADTKFVGTGSTSVNPGLALMFQKRITGIQNIIKNRGTGFNNVLGLWDNAKKVATLDQWKKPDEKPEEETIEIEEPIEETEEEEDDEKDIGKNKEKLKAKKENLQKLRKLYIGDIEKTKKLIKNEENEEEKEKLKKELEDDIDRLKIVDRDIGKLKFGPREESRGTLTPRGEDKKEIDEYYKLLDEFLEIDKEINELSDDDLTKMTKKADQLKISNLIEELKEKPSIQLELERIKLRKEAREKEEKEEIEKPKRERPGRERREKERSQRGEFNETEDLKKEKTEAQERFKEVQEKLNKITKEKKLSIDDLLEYNNLKEEEEKLAENIKELNKRLPEPEQKITTDQKQKFIKLIEANPAIRTDLISSITKSFPSVDKRALGDMKTEDLIETSLALGMMNISQLQNIDRIQAPSTATQQQVELAKTLENLRRQRELDDETKKLRQSFTSDEAKQAREAELAKLKEMSKRISSKARKPISKTDIEQAKPLSKKIKDINQKAAMAQILSSTIGQNPSVQLSDKQLNAGNISDSLKEMIKDISENSIGAKVPEAKKKERTNKYIEFMKNFRKVNAGKLPEKELRKELSKAWQQHKILPLSNLDIELEGGNESVDVTRSAREPEGFIQPIKKDKPGLAKKSKAQSLNEAVDEYADDLDTFDERQQLNKLSYITGRMDYSGALKSNKPRTSTNIAVEKKTGKKREQFNDPDIGLTSIGKALQKIYGPQ